MDEENWIIFKNVIKMNDENIEKFKKLYGEGQYIHPLDSLFDERKLSFSQIIPEVQKNNANKEWFDNSKQDVWSFFEEDKPELIGKALAKWRLDHWGTSSDLLYEDELIRMIEDGPSLQTLERVLKGECQFFTMCRPPIKIYEKMAADGLVFETKWWSRNDGPRAYDEWAIGEGQVAEGLFQYHIGPMTGEQEMSLEAVVKDFFGSGKDKDNRTTIVAKNREHLDQLIQYVQEFLKRNLYTQGIFSLISEISKNTIILDKVLDLNFIDVSNVPDLSNLFANFDISPFPEKGWFCKIKLDISRWNRSKVTDC